MGSQILLTCLYTILKVTVVRIALYIRGNNFHLAIIFLVESLNQVYASGCLIQMFQMSSFV